MKAPEAARDGNRSRSPSLQITACGQAMMASMSGSSMATTAHQGFAAHLGVGLEQIHQGRLGVGAAHFGDLGECQAVVGRFRQEVGKEDIVRRHQVGEDVLRAVPPVEVSVMGTRS